jgi:NADPH:quinone reductase-like Zn-dependent oxidoreductase
MAVKTKDLGWNEAASLPLAGCSALQAIEEHINLMPGQKILIHGGAGGIGTLAIQLAKMRQAYVATTAKVSDTTLLTGLGADMVIDYESDDFAAKISEYDAVFDTVGGEVTNKSLAVIKNGGILVTMIGQIDEATAAQRGIKAVRQMTGVTTERLAKLGDYFTQGKLKPIVDKVFPLAETREAYEYFVDGHPKGKVVVVCV